jgi:hypothetical protein
VPEVGLPQGRLPAHGAAGTGEPLDLLEPTTSRRLMHSAAGGGRRQQDDGDFEMQDGRIVVKARAPIDQAAWLHWLVLGVVSGLMQVGRLWALVAG